VSVPAVEDERDERNKRESGRGTKVTVSEG
jgi:hypothetical protein